MKQWVLKWLENVSMQCEMQAGVHTREPLKSFAVTRSPVNSPVLLQLAVFVCTPTHSC